MALRTRAPWARALLPATRSRASGQLEALLSSPVLGVRLMTALQVLQVLSKLCGAGKRPTRRGVERLSIPPGAPLRRGGVVGG